MASGDVINYVQNAGSGNVISYTAAAGVNVMITNMGGLNWGVLELNSWVSSTTGVNYWAIQTEVSGGRECKMLLCAGQTISKTDPQIDIHGFSFAGIQV